MSEGFLEDDLDIFVDNEQKRSPAVIGEGGGKRSVKSSIVSRISIAPFLGNLNQRISTVNFGSDADQVNGDLRMSTVGGLKKNELRQMSFVKFGKNKSIKRLKGDSNRHLNSDEHDEDLPQLLCLHGWRSNSEITKIHLENLQISDKFHKVFIHGPIKSNKPADEAIGILTPGPYYSWTAQDQKEGTEVNVMEIIESLKSLILHLLLVPDSKIGACYDAVYGFSQSVSLIALLSFESVRNCILNEMGMPPMIRKPWNFVIAACGANTNIVKKVLEHYEIPLTLAKGRIPSVHIIGISDTFKQQSEEILLLFRYKEALTFYLDSGHEIPVLTQRLEYLPLEIMEWFSEFETQFSSFQNTEQGLPYSRHKTPMIDVTYDIHEFTSAIRNMESMDIGTLEVGTFGQYAFNQIVTSHYNLLDMLRDANPASIALYTPGAPPLTYGALLEFIYGEADLRKIGAMENYTVAYLAPLGVVSAVAFLAFSCQCTAAPLDPAYTEGALLLAFKQL